MFFKQDSTKKSHYVDGHEKMNKYNINLSSSMNMEYLTKVEPRCHRWIQLTSDELKAKKIPSVVIGVYSMEVTILHGMGLKFLSSCI